MSNTICFVGKLIPTNRKLLLIEIFSHITYHNQKYHYQIQVFQNERNKFIIQEIILLLVDIIIEYMK